LMNFSKHAQVRLGHTRIYFLKLMMNLNFRLTSWESLLMIMN